MSKIISLGLLLLLVLLWKPAVVDGYAFQSSIDNLLYIENTSTLFAISSSHLHQLHWSAADRTLLLLHRRVQLHASIDNTEYGVSVFVYDPFRQLLIICARSFTGRCILYDANDISRTYQLDSALETNYLGCLFGCFTFISSNIIRSALIGNRLERNGNIINSQIELGKDLLSYNIKYQLSSSDKTLITSLTFLPERLSMKNHYEFIYGFDDEQFTYYVLKSSRIARLCQSSIAMRVTYDEIPILHCHSTMDNTSIITGAFHSFDRTKYLFIVYDRTICVYSMEEIQRAFQASKLQCQAGDGYRIAHIVDSMEGRPMCEKILEEKITDANACTWQPYRANSYMDGTVGARGDRLYGDSIQDVNIQFIFAHENIVIVGTGERRVLKFIRSNQMALNLVHEAAYHNGPFNSQYVIDYEHESLIFAVGSELHRYAYNSCSLYDSCRSCVGSRRYDSKACVWSNNQCILSINAFTDDRGCPPSIGHVQPINVSVNTENVALKLLGSFEGVRTAFVKVTVQFSFPNQNRFPCEVKELHNDSLTCNLIVPKQRAEGIVAVEVQPERTLLMGDTDTTGSIEYTEKLNIYVPKPTLVPSYGPMAGGTKIRIRNLTLDSRLDFSSVMKVYLGPQLCHITEVNADEVECINQPCQYELEQLELAVHVDNRPWQIEKTYFHCRTNPTVADWSPKRSIFSGGLNIFVTGENFDAVQTPMMKVVSNESDAEYVTTCRSTNSSHMACVSPAIEKSLASSLPLNFEVSFTMDNLAIRPNDHILAVDLDPVYHSFDDYSQELNSTSIIRFQGKNLAITDAIDVRIDQVGNACLPLNLTNTDLTCELTDAGRKTIEDSEANVEIRIGRNLTYFIGKINFYNRTQSSLSSITHPTKQTSSTMMIALILLSSITILSVVFLLAIFVRRYYYHSVEKFRRINKPPQYYQDVWCELGKKWQINLKSLTLGEKIGQGCFGDVYRGELQRSETEKIEVAVKVLRDQNVSSMHEFLYEANRMKEFSHANVLSLIGVSWDPVRKAMVLLPYMKNGDLRSYISNEKNRPTVRQLITWAIQVADGMEYLSSLKFIHRDLATRNCMLDEELICRISDFGLSRDIVDRDYYLVPRTITREKDGQSIQVAPRRLPIRWLSPESIESSKYTVQSDVWSFGIFLWELMSRGKTPYPGIDNADVYTYVRNGYRLPQPTYCPALLYKSAMTVCWNSDPAKRPLFAQLAHDIRHTLSQLELEQQQHLQRQQSSSADDDDTTIVERFPGDQRLKRLSVTSMSSFASNDGQYITTPHRQSENIQLLFDRDEDDSYAVAVNSSSDFFTTTRLLPRYTETCIAEDV